MVADFLNQHRSPRRMGLALEGVSGDSVQVGDSQIRSIFLQEQCQGGSVFLPDQGKSTMGSGCIECPVDVCLPAYLAHSGCAKEVSAGTDRPFYRISEMQAFSIRPPFSSGICG